PLRSGPTLVPLPNVWHAIQRLRKMSLGAAGSRPANRGAADDPIAARASAARNNGRQRRAKLVGPRIPCFGRVSQLLRRARMPQSFSSGFRGGNTSHTRSGNALQHGVARPLWEAQDSGALDWTLSNPIAPLGLGECPDSMPSGLNQHTRLVNTHA